MHEGILYRAQGKGTFVSYPKLEQPLSAFYSFSSVLKAKGIQQNDVILGLSLITVFGHVAQKLDVA
ncbi:hypothetical protein GCM10025859_06840 [Alicyclobacillus fastidiosus]|nr:hypothetical protein GCM10025859_06840 [Alicyclobacillus fastidiosus]